MKASDSCNNRIVHAALFNALWALYVLLHIYKLTPWTSAVSPGLQVTNWLIISSALFVIFRPSNVWLFLVLNCLHFTSVLIQLPAMANCWLFSGILSAGFIGSYLAEFWTSGCSKLNVAVIYQRFSPALRLSLIALYGFAVLAKLNTAFLDVNSSCASCFCELMFLSYGISPTPEWILWSAIPATIVVESTIPLLLLFRKTRFYGVLLGLVFHTAIAHSYKILVFDFSALMLVLYYSFTDPCLVETLKESKNANALRWIAKNRQVVFAGLTTLVLGVILGLCNYPNFVFALLYKFRGIIWTVIGCGIAIFALNDFAGRRHEIFNVAQPFRIRSFVTATAFAIVLFNGVSPYLGLKTGVSYTMFSNLRTERGFENHLFMPPALKIFPYQNESVLPLESSEPEIQKLADAKEMLLLHDFRSKVSQFPMASVRYRINDEEYFCESIATDPLIGKPLSYLENKLLFFRSIPTYKHRHQW